MSDFETNRRGSEEPIPGNLDSMLNDKQKATITELTNIGWELWFVRRPKFQPVIPVMLDKKNDSIAMVGEDGNVLEEFITQVRRA